MELTQRPPDPCRVAALVPAYNEAALVGATVSALRAIPGLSHIIVIDDGSTDDTAAAALRGGASCFSLGRNAGKGEALTAGVATLKSLVASGSLERPRVVLLADADLGPSAVFLRALVDAVATDRADLAIADLPPQPGAAGAGITVGLARWILQRAGGGRYFAEPLSGQRAITWQALMLLQPFAPRFAAEVGMTVDALRLGMRIVEVPVSLHHAATGADLRGTLHRGAQARALVSYIGGRATRGIGLRASDGLRKWLGGAGRPLVP